MLDEARVPVFDVPAGLATTELRPYVSRKTPLIKTAPPDFDALLAKMVAAHEEAAHLQATGAQSEPTREQ